MVIEKDYILNNLFILYIQSNYVVRTHTGMYGLFFWKEKGI